MLAVTAGDGQVLLGVIVGVIALSGAFGGSYVFRGSRNRSINEQRSDVITELQADRDFKAEQIRSLQAHVESLETQVKVLREQVTQAAKVDLLRVELHEGFADIARQIQLLKGPQP